MRKKKRKANLTAKNYQISCKKYFFSLNSYKLAAMHAVQTFQSNGLSRLNRGGSGLEFPKNKNKEGIYKFESIHFFLKKISLWLGSPNVQRQRVRWEGDLHPPESVVVQDEVPYADLGFRQRAVVNLEAY